MPSEAAEQSHTVCVLVLAPLVTKAFAFMGLVVRIGWEQAVESQDRF